MRGFLNSMLERMLDYWRVLSSPSKYFSLGFLTVGGFLAGIGFTMALFIAGLALEGDVLETAKVGILAGSLLAGVIGFVMLRTLLPEPVEA